MLLKVTSRRKYTRHQKTNTSVKGATYLEKNACLSFGATVWCRHRHPNAPETTRQENKTSTLKNLSKELSWWCDTCNGCWRNFYIVNDRELWWPQRQTWMQMNGVLHSWETALFCTGSRKSHHVRLMYRHIDSMVWFPSPFHQSIATCQMK